MANNNSKNENDRVAMSIMVARSVREAVEKIAEEEERSLANTTERLLRASPKVRNILAAEAAA